MEMTMEMTQDPNMLIAKKSTKEKLKEWYKRNFDKTKENDVLRKVMKTAGDLYSTAMTTIINVVAPEFSALAPLSRIQADIGLKAYDGIKSAADQAAGIEYKDDNTESTSYLNEDETKALAETSSVAFDKLSQKISESSKKKSEEMKKAMDKSKVKTTVSTEPVKVKVKKTTLSKKPENISKKPVKVKVTPVKSSEQSKGRSR